ncbi:hypothetical protein I350_06895 [Cryptococcus amylolentus CBS 6273]|uniref:F-box domain-containing protein n=1 Tax=Cryptococcus amylolentus CBS 6273 TaxID=1296118 RepID=A0A1E3JI01_9TREE|nr:hypothetical protein I350_06895 [Cryptococcus amylolentus CBS 6273]
MQESPPLQRHLNSQAELLRAALALPPKLRRELTTSLLWSLPRNDVLQINETISSMLQKDIVGSLPPELSFLILGQLELDDLLHCTLVSKTWARLCSEQALWAYLCASHSPPIKPMSITWQDITTNRILPPSTQEDTDDPTFDVSPSDERLSNHYELLSAHAAQHDSGGAAAADPLGMSGGLRRDVWERGGAGIGETLPTHLHKALDFWDRQQEARIIDAPVASHMAVPSAKPQVNFKQLLILHHVLRKRMTTPRPIGSNISQSQPFTTGKVHRDVPRPPPLPKPRAIDAISSVKYGGLPGHSEAVYSLTLVNHAMKITMLQVCPDCNVQLGINPGLPGAAEGQFQRSVMNYVMSLDGVPSSSRRASLDDSATNRNVVSGRDWLLSGSRDKTLRLWQLTPVPRVVKIFHGGHTSSVLTHSIVTLPEHGILPLLSPSSPSKLSRFSLDRELKKRLMAVSGGSDGRICLWDVEGGSGEPVKCVNAHEQSVLCVRADEERVVSCSKDKTIKVFDIYTLEELMVIGGATDPRMHRGAVNAVGLSKDLIVSASGDRSLRVWSIHTGALLACVDGHHRGIASIDVCQAPEKLPFLRKGQTCKGTIITGSSDASIKSFHLIEEQPSVSDVVHGDLDRWSASESEPEDENMHNAHHPLPSPPLTQIPTELTERNTKIALIERDVFWSPCVCPPGLMRPDASGTCARCYNRGHLDLVRSVHLGKDVVLSASYDATVKIWNRKSGRVVADLKDAHAGRIFCVVGDRLRVVSSGLDCRINIWDFSEGLDTSFVEP